MANVFIKGFKQELNGKIRSDSKASNEGGTYTLHNDRIVSDATVHDAREFVKMTEPKRMITEFTFFALFDICDEIVILFIIVQHIDADARDTMIFSTQKTAENGLLMEFPTRMQIEFLM